MGIALREDEQAELLGTHGTAVLATVSRRGVPVPLPVWYVVDDGQVYVRTPRAAKRLDHLAHNPSVGLVVHDGEAWQELRGLLITGRAVVVTDDQEDARVRQLIAERFAALLPPPLPPHVAARYGDSVVLRIEAHTEPRSWDNRKVRM